MRLILILLFIFNGIFYSQTHDDDLSRIVLNTYLEPNQEGMSDKVSSILENKLNQIALKNGVGGDALNPRFIITAKVAILSKEVTPTAPPMHALTLDVTFYIGDGIDGIKYGTTNINLKGVGKNESKAFISALNNIKPTNSIFKSFVSDSKQKIMDYYNNNCDIILKEAEAMVSMNQFDEAIEKLIVVPKVSSDCYYKCMAKAYETYQANIDHRCQINLADARNIWNSGQDYEAALKAKESLSMIDPNASCYSDALIFSEEIAKRIKEIDQRDWDFKMKQEENALLLNQQRLNNEAILKEKRLENESKRLDIQQSDNQQRYELEKSRINAIKEIYIQKIKQNSVRDYNTSNW